MPAVESLFSSFIEENGEDPPAHVQITLYAHHSLEQKFRIEALPGHVENPCYFLSCRRAS